MSHPSSQLPAPAHPAPARPPYLPRGNGVGVAAVIVGSIALALSLLPLIGLVSVGLGAVGVVLGLIALSRKGRKQGTSFTGLVLGAVAIIAALAMQAFVTTVVTATVSAHQAVDRSSVLRLDKGWKVEQEGSAFRVVGRVTNGSEEPIRTLATITFSVLDSDGGSTGACVDSVGSIEASGSWEFEAACTVKVSKGTTVRFDEITGF